MTNPTGSDLTQVITPTPAGTYRPPFAAKFHNGYDIAATDAYIARVNEACNAAMGQLDRERAARASAEADRDTAIRHARESADRLTAVEKERDELKHRLDNPLETVGRTAQAFLNEARAQAKGIVDKANADAADIMAKARGDAEKELGAARAEAARLTGEAERKAREAETALAETVKATEAERGRAKHVREDSAAGLRALIDTLTAAMHSVENGRDA